MTNKYRFCGLSISDIHLAINRLNLIQTLFILTNFIFPYLKKINFLLISGDIFDGPLSTTDVSFLPIHDFLVTLLKLANENNVTIRFLRGTFSHDRNQIQWIMHQYHALGCTNDVAYFDTIDAEYIPSLDITIGYIPDTLTCNTSDDAVNMLKEKASKLKNGGKLDYVAFHGYFRHVIDLNAQLSPKHIFSAEQFDFVKKCVFAGHVHTPAIYKNIYYNGSTIRMAHGEEEDKGGYFFKDYKDHVKVEFVKNEQSPIFKTLDFSNTNDTGVILEKYSKKLTYYTEHFLIVFIRFVHPDISIRQAIKQYTRQNFPTVNFTHTSPKDKNLKQQVEIDDSTVKLDLHEYSRESLVDDIISFINNTEDVVLSNKCVTNHLNNLS